MSALCCPFTQDIPTTRGANFTLDLGPICNGKPSSNYGFTTYSLDFQVVESDLPFSIYRVNAANSASTSLLFSTGDCQTSPQCPPATVENAVIIVTTVGDNQVVIKSKTNVAAGTKAGLSWNFQFLGQDIAEGTLCPGALNLEGSTPTETVPPNPDYASVFGLVRGTPDGNQICQTNFRVVYPQAKIDEYVFYCTNIVPVLKGTGCTLVEKANSLGLSPSQVGSYAMLRLFLSKLLFQEEQLNIQLLRQEYYQAFIRRLRKSEFAPYASVFENNPLRFAFKR